MSCVQYSSDDYDVEIEYILSKQTHRDHNVYCLRHCTNDGLFVLNSCDPDWNVHFSTNGCFSSASLKMLARQQVVHSRRIRVV